MERAGCSSDKCVFQYIGMPCILLPGKVPNHQAERVWKALKAASASNPMIMNPMPMTALVLA